MNIEDMTWLRQEDGDLFGRRVQAWLAMHRIGHADLAEACGIDPYGLSRALNGRRPFPASLALAISKYTGLAVAGNSVTFNPNRAQDLPRSLPTMLPEESTPALLAAPLRHHDSSRVALPIGSCTTSLVWS
jgi:hypothetical protein